MSVLGIGVDVVSLSDFAAQLEQPGSKLLALYSAREVRQAEIRGREKGDGRGVHLAARWAGKEAVLKAWFAALGQNPPPYTVDDFPWAEVEILADKLGRPQVIFGERAAMAVEESLGVLRRCLRWNLSLSHDGPVALAFLVLEKVG